MMTVLGIAGLLFLMLNFDAYKSSLFSLLAIAFYVFGSAAMAYALLKAELISVNTIWIIITVLVGLKCVCFFIPEGK